MSVRVPGAFELPAAARRLAAGGGYDAIVCLGAVIRGETPHFDYVAGESARGIADAARDFDLPVTFGVITADTEQQARARAGGSAGNKGREAMLAAIEMATLFAGLAPGRTLSGRIGDGPAMKLHDDLRHPSGGEAIDRAAQDAIRLAHRAMARFPHVVSRNKFIAGGAAVSSALVALAGVAVTRRMRGGASAEQAVQGVTEDELSGLFTRRRPAARPQWRG